MIKNNFSDLKIDSILYLNDEFNDEAVRFYQVLKITKSKKSVYLREIKSLYNNFDIENLIVLPDKNNFLSDAFRRKIKKFYYNGQINFEIEINEYSNLNLWTNEIKFFIPRIFFLNNNYIAQ